MIEQSSVFDAVRRGYSEFKFSSEEEIIDYFSAVETDSIIGHAANIKGILFEQQVSDYLNNTGVEAALFDATNHPDTDITLNIDGYLPLDLQLKATDSTSYINQTLADNPDIPIITTSELAERIESEMVFDSGIENAQLEHVVFESLFPELLYDMKNEEISEMTLSELSNQSLEVSNISASFVEEGLVEAVSDIAVPISPIGIVLGVLGLPFV